MYYYLWTGNYDKKLIFRSIAHFRSKMQGSVYCADTRCLGEKTIMRRIKEYGYCACEDIDSGIYCGALEKVMEG